ncbi:MAG TPA: ketopantoate reductase family protein [Candidatus Acidoferrales bacterium]|nr:ketopantoate reductase family protein [Candidatus Acidoferrales bacterium]
MKICIVGCGAIGSLFAAHLARLDGVDVYAYDVSLSHVEAIQKNGLRISGAANFTSPVKAATKASEIPVCDYGIVATKSTHTRVAVEQTAGVFNDRSVVCSVQNGVGNEEIIAEHVRFVMRGTTFPAGHIIEPGHVGFDIQGDTWVGPFEPSGTPFERVRELADLITRAGMNVVALEDARGAQWTKLIFNASTNPVGALTLLHHGAATRYQPTGELFNNLIAEGEAVAKALGVKLHGNPRDMVLKGANAPGKHNASMLQDVLVKRLTEVDFMNGAIVRWGEKTGVPTPLNKTMWALIKGLEHSWTNP